LGKKKIPQKGALNKFLFKKRPQKKGGFKNFQFPPLVNVVRKPPKRVFKRGICPKKSMCPQAPKGETPKKGVKGEKKRGTQTPHPKAAI